MNHTDKPRTYRRSRKVFSALLAAALVLFGCQFLVPTQEAEPENAVSPYRATRTARAAETIPETSTEEAPEGSKGIIKIATQSPLSGALSSTGADIKNGAELYVRQHADMLVRLGYAVQLAPYDDQGNPDKGVANARQIVADPNVLCIVGHYNSGVQIPSSEVYHTAGLANVSPANTNPKVTDRGYLEVSRVVGRDDMQGRAAAMFAVRQNLISAYILHDKTTYGQGLAEFFKQEAEAHGIHVLGFEGTEEKANFSALLGPILGANPDVIYFGGMFDQVATFISQARQAGYTGMFLSGDGLDAPEAARIAGTEMISGRGTYFTTTAGPSSYYEGARQFEADFQAAFGRAPLPFAAQGYDAAGVCMKAIEQAALMNGGEMPSREAVAQAVRALQDYPGITGKIRFNSRGDLVNAQYYVIRVSQADPDLWPSNQVADTIPIPPDE